MGTVPRRSFFRVGGLGFAAAAVSPWPLGARRQAAPNAVHTRTTLVLAPWAFAGEPLQEGAQLLYHLCEPFLAAHPGVDLSLDVSVVGNSGELVPSIIAGTAPDVFQDWNYWYYNNLGVLLPLESYVQRDNMDLAAFNRGQLEDYYDPQGHLLALPAQSDPCATAVNLTVLDDLGLQYPSDAWTYQEAEHLWRAAAGQVKGKHRYGGEIYSAVVMAGQMPSRFYLKGWGGDYVDPSDATKCAVSSAASIQALEWALPLLREGICGWGWDGLGGFRTGALAQRVTGSWNMPWQAAQWRGFKWRYYPMPVWPKGRTAYVTLNFWGISGTTKQPELAWELLKFVGFSPQWQRGMMQLFLTPPTLKQYWSEWEGRVLAVAPPLRDKNVTAFSAPAVADQLYPDKTFTYATAQSYGILGGWYAQAVAGKVSVIEAMQQGARQVDALQVAQAQAASSVGSGNMLAGYRTLSHKQSYTPPPTDGLGVPPSSGASLVAVGNGTYALEAGGWDIWNDSDNCTLACFPSTAARGVYTCRVIGLSNVDCPSISPWAKFGLMARGDLSDDAADVTLEASGFNGVAAQLRFEPGFPPSAQTQGDPQASAGLLGQSYVTVDNTESAKLANYLKQPVWLRMVRDAVNWTFYTSLDGRKWTQAGAPYAAYMGGCWIGIFADAGNFQFGGKGRIRVEFDNLSFKPTRFVQVGKAETA